MEQVKLTTKAAGVDVGKRRLDVAVHGQEEQLVTSNDAAGWAEVVEWVKSRGVTRVGLEASGGYERAVRSALEQAGLDVVVHQPMEVKHFARWRRIRVKTDPSDARLIAAATAQADGVRWAQDPRLQELAERFTAYEQVSGQAAQLKTFLEHVTLADLKTDLCVQIQTLERLKAQIVDAILKVLKAHADLLERFQLLRSLPGIGPVTAAALVVRMPELGSMNRGQAASLLGVAPITRESGAYKGASFIAGGRARPRRFVYLAAIGAKRCDPTFKAFAQNLADRGKPPKLINVAIMRKLVEAANLVLQRGQPWQLRTAT